MLTKRPFYNIDKTYLVKVSTKGEGRRKNSKNMSTWFMDGPKNESPNPDPEKMYSFSNNSFRVSRSFPVLYVHVSIQYGFI